MDFFPPQNKLKYFISVMMSKHDKLSLTHSLTCVFFTDVHSLTLVLVAHSINIMLVLLPSNYLLYCCFPAVKTIISQLEPECHHLANLLNLTYSTRPIPQGNVW